MEFTVRELPKQNVFLETDYYSTAKYSWDLYMSTQYNMNWKVSQYMVYLLKLDS